MGCEGSQKDNEKCLAAKEDPYLALLEHRNTPSVDIELSPAQRLLGRRTKTRIPLAEDQLNPHQIPWITISRRLKKRMERETETYNKGSHPLPALTEGDTVWIQPLGTGSNKWER